MLKELRGIRQALERLAQPPAPAPQPAAAPAPPARAKLDNVTGYMLGRSEAPLTMVEFTDLQCPYCNRFATQTFDQIKAAYIDTGKLRFISRDFPLDFHPQAMPAARASRCAGEQGKFWELRTALVRNASQLGPAFIASTAETLKLDMPAFRACLDSDKYTAEIQKNIQEGSGAGVQGTPSFVLGRTTAQGLDGVLIVGAQPFANFDAEIKKLLAAQPPPR